MSIFNFFASVKAGLILENSFMYWKNRQRAVLIGGKNHVENLFAKGRELMAELNLLQACEIKTRSH